MKPKTESSTVSSDISCENPNMRGPKYQRYNLHSPGRVRRYTGGYPQPQVPAQSGEMSLFPDEFEESLKKNNRERYHHRDKKAPGLNRLKAVNAARFPRGFRRHAGAAERSHHSSQSRLTSKSQESKLSQLMNRRALKRNSERGLPLPPEEKEETDGSKSLDKNSLHNSHSTTSGKPPALGHTETSDKNNSHNISGDSGLDLVVSEKDTSGKEPKPSVQQQKHQDLLNKEMLKRLDGWPKPQKPLETGAFSGKQGPSSGNMVEKDDHISGGSHQSRSSSATRSNSLHDSGMGSQISSTTRPVNDSTSTRKSSASSKGSSSDTSIKEKAFSSITEEEAYEKLTWDIAQIIPKERISANESFEGFVKFLRVFMYCLIFTLLLACVTISAGCVLLLEAAIVKDDLHRSSAQNQLLWIICFPHLLIFVISSVKTMFGNYPWPSWTLACLIIGVEVIHTLGVSILVFRILPFYGSFYSVGIINSICIVPVILKLFFTNSEVADASMRCRPVVWRVLDIIALCVQVASIIFPLIVIEVLPEDLRWASNTERFSLQHHPSLRWQIPLGLLFVSVKWWENFVSINRGRIALRKLKKAFHRTRTTSAVFVSVLNILVTIASLYILDAMAGKSHNFPHDLKPALPKNINSESYEAYDMSSAEGGENGTNVTFFEIEDSCGRNGTNCFTEIHDNDGYFVSFAPAITCIACSLVAYYLAGLACKVMMQQLSFALPLAASSPVLIAIMLMQCNGVIPKLPDMSGLRFEFLCDEQSVYQVIIASLVWWVSFVWITRHIWSPDIDRLAFNERIFVVKMFCGPFVAQSLMLNRRNDHQDKKMELFHGLKAETYNTSTVTGGNQTGDTEKKNARIVPMIYACGTMWHETKNEMMQLLKSIFRMDLDQMSRKVVQEMLNIVDPDYYEFEAHIFFDDCMDIDDNDKWVPNQFVIQFINCIEEAASAVLEEVREMEPPVKTATPYGGTLCWRLPGGNNMIVHLKDKGKIRHRKRWSQVMYMYYLLGYRIFDEPCEEIDNLLNSANANNNNSNNGEKSENNDMNASAMRPKTGWVERARRTINNTKHFGKSDIFTTMNEEVLLQTENTFILALDGDVDFKPDAVRLLVDRMRVNQKTGAACGRIHPIGSGPLVWYQTFEYAIGHWFQKATEHVLGCVLCSPGCFSLFRASALLDDNVMKRYTTEPTEAAHYLQYDQGEDRWLCTLMLQQGYRVDYCAAADALTYAPEHFNEFFNQRRRWTPSTIANIIDLLSDAKNTVLVNANISYLYVLYQFILLVAMVLGPSTIILAIATAFQSVFDVKLWQSYLLSLAPVFFYLAICFKCKTNTQLTVAAFLSAFYACIMTVVLVGIIQTIVSQSILNPSLLFLGVISASFVFSGIMHPYEFPCLMHGILYYLCIPAGYLVLIIYSISNLHIVSWGTREVKKRKSKAQMEREKLLEQQKALTAPKKKAGIISFLRLDVFLKDLKDTLMQAFSGRTEATSQKQQLKTMKKVLKELRRIRQGDTYESSDSESDEEKSKKQGNNSPDQALPPALPASQPIPDDEEIEVPPDDPENPNWIKDPRLGDGLVGKLTLKEKKFWEAMIKKYLEPLKKDAKKEKAMLEELLELRTNSSFGFWFINLLWVLFNYMVNRDSELNTIYLLGYETQPLGFIFIIFFVIVLVLQIIGMAMHRWGTFLQLISITEITPPLRHKTLNSGSADLTPNEAVKVAKNLHKQNTFFGDDQSSDMDDNTYDIIPDAQKKKLLHNLRKLSTHIPPKPIKKPVQKRDHFAVDIETPSQDHYGTHDIQTGLEKYEREKQARRRLATNYKEAIPRNFERQFNRGYEQDRRHRYIPDRRGPQMHGRYEERDRRNYRPSARDNDVEMRLRRRLRRLASRDF